MDFQEKGEFFKELKSLVNEYLKGTPIKAVGPKEMFLKSALLILSWIFCYLLLITAGPHHNFIALISLPLLLLFSSSLLFCIMHDASHQAFSSSRLINRIILNATLSVIGGCSFSWHQEHVVRHHGHTNVLGEDPDVYASHVLRLHPEDKLHFWHRWQHLYGIPLYSLMWVHWVYNDLINAMFNTYGLSGRKYFQFWTQIVIGLIPHIVLGLILPYYAYQSFYLVGIFYTIFFMCLSLAMALTFVLAHVSDGQTFFMPHEEIKRDWALHQLQTTADFAVDNPLANFFLGGLNFQVEHHIFPSICHLHYPKIQKIVKKYCEEKNLPYHEEKTVWDALKKHIAHLKAMGRPLKETKVVGQQAL